MKIINIVEKYKNIKAAVADGAIYCGRGSPLGNPYSHLEGTKALYIVDTREEAIDGYRRWLYDKLKNNDRAVVTALEALKADSVLACWCKPLACHCEVIIAAWEWWQLRHKML